MLQGLVVYDSSAEEPVFVHVRREAWSVLRGNKEQRKQLMEGIADTDACLAGRPRSIYLFDPDSNMLGKATPTGGIELL